MSLQNYTQIIFRDITSLGSLYIYMIIALIFLFLGDYVLFLRFGFGAVFTFLISVIIRLIYFKERPNKQEYSNLFEKIDAGSFPSIHAARASFMFLILNNYFQNILIAIFLLLIALLVLYSRIYLKKHDIVDVGGGIIIGLVLGFLALNFIV